MNSSGNWLVSVDSSIYKAIGRFPRKDAERILGALSQLATDPYQGDTGKLGGKERLWRRRVGSYRIFYLIDVQARRIDVSEVERRGSKTY